MRRQRRQRAAAAWAPHCCERGRLALQRGALTSGNNSVIDLRRGALAQPRPSKRAMAAAAEVESGEDNGCLLPLPVASMMRRRRAPSLRARGWGWAAAGTDPPPAPPYHRRERTPPLCSPAPAACLPTHPTPPSAASDLFSKRTRGGCCCQVRQALCCGACFGLRWRHAGAVRRLAQHLPHQQLFHIPPFLALPAGSRLPG